jgi:transposase
MGLCLRRKVEEEEMRMSVGVDLHKMQFTVCWKKEGDEEGRCERFDTTEMGYQGFESQLRKAQSSSTDIAVAVESTGNTRYFKHRVEKVGIEVVVINTAKFKVITESVKKTDHHDSATIAEFLEKGMLPEARICSNESEELRRIVKTRRELVNLTVRVKNQLYGLLLSYGIAWKKSGLASKKSRRRALSVLEEQGHAGVAAEPLIETIELLEEQVKSYEKVLKEKVKGDRVVELIQTIPGAGLITAATIRAYTDDISRFASAKKYAAYAGLVPWVRDSAEVQRHGKITKRGPKELRTAFVQIVIGMVRMKRRTAEYRLMQRYVMMKRQKGSGKSIIAISRKLATIVWHMLTHDEEFDPLRMTDAAVRKAAREMRKATLHVA